MRCLVFASGQTIAPPSKVLNTLVAWKLSTDRSPWRRTLPPLLSNAERVGGVVDHLEAVAIGDLAGSASRRRAGRSSAPA